MLLPRCFNSEADTLSGPTTKTINREAAGLFMNRAFKLLVIVLAVIGAVALLILLGMWAMHLTMMGRG